MMAVPALHHGFLLVTKEERQSWIFPGSLRPLPTKRPPPLCAN